MLGALVRNAPISLGPFAGRGELFHARGDDDREIDARGDAPVDLEHAVPVAAHDRAGCGAVARQDHVPIVRSGRRAPHLWLDEGEGVSILDLFGQDYVAVLSQGADASAWAEAAEAMRRRGFPLRVEALPTGCAAGSPARRCRC